MKQQVIIPWRDMDCIYRRKHFDFLTEYYSQEFDVIIANNEGEFNRSAARNSGVEKSTSEISVIIDADNFIKHQHIYEAVELAKQRDALIKPFRFFGYLTEESTDKFYHFFGILDIEYDFVNGAQRGFTGGAYVMKKSLWQGIGGMDEGFVGWGAEDDAFHLLVEKKLGRVIPGAGTDVHLYHPAHRVTSDYNYQKLQRDYLGE
jgi:predicted glycosyltransferase involved in capsule biosynthesis